MHGSLTPIPAPFWGPPPTADLPRTPEPLAGLLLGGLVRLTLSDYPGRVACAAFTAGCNFRCPWCHNPHLVPSSTGGTTAETVLAHLDRRRGQVDGLVVTGGEPTLQPGLPDFLDEVRRRGVRVKLDTNGSRPEVVAELVGSGLVAYVALDVKGPWERYDEMTGVRDAAASVRRTLDLLRASGIPFETRTTVVPGLLDEGDLAAMAPDLRGVPTWFLQPFVPGRTLDEGLSGRSLRAAPLDLPALAAALTLEGSPCRARGR